jgi:hypothetical protein
VLFPYKDQMPYVMAGVAHDYTVQVFYAENDFPTYSWDFGDGQPAGEPRLNRGTFNGAPGETATVSHTYEPAGTHSVSVSAMNAAGKGADSAPVGVIARLSPGIYHGTKSDEYGVYEMWVTVGSDGISIEKIEADLYAFAWTSRRHVKLATTPAAALDFSDEYREIDGKFYGSDSTDARVAQCGSLEVGDWSVQVLTDQPALIVDVRTWASCSSTTGNTTTKYYTDADTRGIVTVGA